MRRRNVKAPRGHGLLADRIIPSGSRRDPVHRRSSLVVRWRGKRSGESKAVRRYGRYAWIRLHGGLCTHDLQCGSHSDSGRAVPQQSTASCARPLAACKLQCCCQKLRRQRGTCIGHSSTREDSCGREPGTKPGIGKRPPPVAVPTNARDEPRPRLTVKTQAFFAEGKSDATPGEAGMPGRSLFNYA